MDAPSVVVRGIPSLAESARLEEEEKKRVEARKAELGEEGLKMWKEKVEKAKEMNEVRIAFSSLVCIGILPLLLFLSSIF